MHNKAYGIYLIHQFILIYLYYHTRWIFCVNPYLIPFFH